MALREKNPVLAQQVTVWRAAYDVDASEFRPCGPPDHDDAGYQHQLEAHVNDDPHWPALARAFTRADVAGFDVEARLPGLIAERPLPETHAGRSLDYRLANACPESLGPIRSTAYPAPPVTTHPAPAPDYTRAVGNPSISRTGPRR